MRRYFYFLLFTFYFSTKAHGQMIENAGDYMTAMTNAQMEMDQKYMAYISASAHSRRAKKVERLRTAGAGKHQLMPNIKRLTCRNTKEIIPFARPASTIFSFVTAFLMKTIPR